MTHTASGLCMGCMSALGDHIVCPRCGFDNSTPYDKKYKKPGSILDGRYILGRLVRKNGEGAVYVGYDNNLQCRVWIKEYFPSTLASRDILTGDIRPLDGCGAQYKALLSDFIDVCNEVKRLSVTEPVVPIENMLAEHGTVYAIFKDMEVIPFETYLAKQGGKLPVAEARDLLLPLLNTLSNIHARSDIHRGISPYTVYIDRSDKLYLWDFCMSATRTGSSELQAELFGGYSAPEQYASNGWQGTWTDVYSAAALFYRTISGFVPPKSTLINEQRPLAPLIDLVMDLPPNISDAVAEAMHTSPQRRTQEIGTFTAKLVHTELSSTAVYDASMVNQVKRARNQKLEEKEEKQRVRKYMILGLLITVVFLSVGLFVAINVFSPSRVRPDKENEQSSQVDPTEDPSEGEIDNTMPDLTGLSAEEITHGPYADRFTFDVREEEFSDTYEKGMIIRQSPNPGVKIADGRTVILYTSKGKKIFKMPDLVGATEEEAAKALDTLGGDDFDFPYTVYPKYVADAEPGTVVGTTPAVDTEFDPKTAKIILFVMPEVESAVEASIATSPSSASSKKESSTSSRMTVEQFREQRNRG